MGLARIIGPIWGHYRGNLEIDFLTLEIGTVFVHFILRNGALMKPPTVRFADSSQSEKRSMI